MDLQRIQTLLAVTTTMLSLPEIFGVMFKLVVQFSITGTHDDQSPYIQLHCNIEYTWVYEQI